MRNTNVSYRRFGPLANNYSIGRLPFPTVVFDYIWGKLRVVTPVTVDLGCGTGIATAQLSSYGAQVVGVDIDQGMLVEAVKTNPHAGLFAKASANKLPFADHQFDLATAFSAFHWFNTPKTINEIRRVLKKDGQFAIVNKNDDLDGLTQEYREIVKRYSNLELLPNVKKRYDAKSSLTNNGFKQIEEKRFRIEEQYPEATAIAYFQSVSLWNLIPSESQAFARRTLSRLIQHHSVNGSIVREVEIVVTIGDVA